MTEPSKDGADASVDDLSDLHTTDEEADAEDSDNGDSRSPSSVCQDHARWKYAKM